MRTLLTAFLLVFLLGGMSITTFAQQRRDVDVKRERMMTHRHQMMHRGEISSMNLPDLTDEQRSQIRDIMLNTRQDILPIQNQLREKQARLRTLTTGDEVNLDEAYKVIDDIGELRTQMMKMRISSRQDVRELLTEEQRVLFDTRPVMNNRRMQQMKMQRNKNR